MNRAEPSAYAEAVFDLVTAVAFESPVVLLVDDVQWADRESRGLVARVARRLSRHPVTVLFTSRDVLDLTELMPEDATSIGLPPLSDAEVAELVSMAVEVRPEEASDRVATSVAHASRGNPLFVGETLKTLADLGHIGRQDDRWVLDASTLPDPIPLPTSMQDLLRQRLDRVGDDERAIVGALAARGGSTGPRALASETGLDAEVFSGALTRLVSRGIIGWISPDEVDFTHEGLRSAVAPPESPPWTRSPRVPFLVAAAVVALLALAGPRLSGGPGAEPFPYGNGVLVLKTNSDFLGLRAPTQLGGDWTVERLSRPFGRNIDNVRRIASGDVVWFGFLQDRVNGPGAVEYLNDDLEPSAIFDAPEADDNYIDVSPDGSWALIRREDDTVDEFAMMDLLIHRETGAERTISRVGAWPGPISDWTPDGRRLLFAPARTLDSVVVLGGVGSARATLQTPDLEVGTFREWCPDGQHLATVMQSGEFTVPALLDIRDGTLRPASAEIEYGIAHACLGERNAVVFNGVIGGRTAVGVYDPELDSIIDLTPLVRPDGGDAATIMGWLPDDPPSVATELLLDREEMELGWGAADTLAARVAGVGGALMPDTVEWISRSPSVASVDRTGVVTGNSPGATWIIAQSSAWHVDSAHVRVSGATGSGPLLYERFEVLEPELWRIGGVPGPVLDVVDGEPALSHNGDGLYNDPLFTLDGTPLPAGGTFEVEFRVPLTRQDRQRAMVCLNPTDGDALLEGRSPAVYGICFQYPSGELALHRRDLAQVTPLVVNANLRVPVPEGFDSSEWNHLAIQILADGTVEFFLNRRHWYSSPWRIDRPADTEWRIVLAGAAVDTRLHYRNLALWEGARYGSGVDAPVPGERRTVAPLEDGGSATGAEEDGGREEDGGGDEGGGAGGDGSGAGGDGESS